MKVTCKNCGAIWNFPDWICNIILEADPEAHIRRCDKCDRVDEWVQDHRVLLYQPKAKTGRGVRE